LFWPIIAGLKAACDARGVVAPDRLETIRAGDSVRILLGPLADCVAQVERIDAGDRARILVEFLGATREVSLAQSALLRSA
jgi:transcription antitermination factor NusG